MYSQLLHGRSHEQDEKRENKEKGAREAWRRASFQTSLWVIAEECSISSCAVFFSKMFCMALPVCDHEEESFNSLIIAAAPDGGNEAAFHLPPFPSHEKNPSLRSFLAATVQSAACVRTPPDGGGYGSWTLQGTSFGVPCQGIGFAEVCRGPTFLINSQSS